MSRLLDLPFALLVERPSGRCRKVRVSVRTLGQWTSGRSFPLIRIADRRTRAVRAAWASHTPLLHRSSWSPTIGAVSQGTPGISYLMSHGPGFTGETGSDRPGAYKQPELLSGPLSSESSLPLKPTVISSFSDLRNVGFQCLPPSGKDCAHNWSQWGNRCCKSKLCHHRAHVLMTLYPGHRLAPRKGRFESNSTRQKSRSVAESGRRRKNNPW